VFLLLSNSSTSFAENKNSKDASKLADQIGQVTGSHEACGYEISESVLEKLIIDNHDTYEKFSFDVNFAYGFHAGYLSQQTGSHKITICAQSKAVALKLGLIVQDDEAGQD